MSKKSSYYLRWYSDAGERYDFPSMIHKMDLVRSENRVGVCSVTVPRAKLQYTDLKVDQIFEVWRTKNNTDGLQNETAYFVRDWEFYRDSEGREFVTVFGYDANYLLDGAIVGYAAASAQSQKTANADNMIKAIVSENLGADAVAARQKITVAGDLSAAPSITKGFSWRNVLKVCQEIAEKSTEDGTYLVFDVVRTNPATFELRTYTGQRGNDHGRYSSDVRLVGKQYGNLEGEKLGTYHSDEVNYVYVGGEGEEDAREIVERTATARVNASAWNRREAFRDARNTKTTAGLQAEGDAVLDARSPKQVMTGRLRDTAGMRYNIEYGFGDIVSVEAFGYFVDCHVATVRQTVTPEAGEQIDVRLRGEL